MTTNNSADNFDDVVTNSTTSNNDNDERTPLLSNDNDERMSLLSNYTEQNASISSTSNADTIFVPSISRYRPTNILRTLLFIEFITILIIWFIGNKYFFFNFYFISKILIK
jgi:hypothetical protein